MAVINFANREISCKIVYFGAAEAGCNTNVRHLHSRLEKGTSQLHRFGPSDRAEATWYFEFRPTEDRLNGFRLRFRIYTLPGGIPDPVHREEVLREVDGVVFVADARPGHQADNESALLSLEEALSSQDIELAGLPVVMQVNHTDDDEAVEIQTVTRPLNAYGFPVHRSAAKTGLGVVETFESVLGAVRQGVSDALNGTTRSMVIRALHDPSDETDDDVVRAHLMAVRGFPGGTPVASERTDYHQPAHEVEIPFQPPEFADCHPVRVLDAQIEDDHVVVDVELEKAGDGTPRGLRVRLANRQTESPAPTARPSPPVVSPIMGVTDHLPDKIEFTATPQSQSDFPAVFYGVAGVLGGTVVGVLFGFLLFH